MGIHKTPLRYPGGKQKLAPFIKEILRQNGIRGHYVEPYAGGAGVAIELLLNDEVQYIHLNDSDLGIYAFWRSVLNENDRFCREVLTASLTIDEWRKHKEIIRHPQDHTLFELGFSTFFLNRCNRSGVLAGGVIGGLNQEGNYKMDARFSRNDLIRRIELIGRYRDKITISNMDAERYIAESLPQLPDNSLIYLDPPYYNKAKALYLNAYNKNDHARLAITIQNIAHNWVLSYDGVSQIVELYSGRRYFLYNLQYSAAKSYQGQEVFIFCDQLRLPNICSLPSVNEGLQTLVASHMA
jgi:DNA adenine methylase